MVPRPGVSACRLYQRGREEEEEEVVVEEERG